MIKKIIIFGTGGNCIDILDIINDINKTKFTYHCSGFLDDNPEQWGKTIYGVKVLGPLSDAIKYQTNHFFINGIGSERNFYYKENILTGTQIPIERFETLIHPSASVSRMSSLGKGSVVFQNVTITSNVRVGNHVIILPNSVLNHDVIIKDYTCIASGVNISGGVTVNSSCYLGTNSSIIGSVEIGENSLIGMGSNVLTDVKENSVMVGNPAIKLRSTLNK
ncbi:NeuD/PglB/VioB family sugar acetyltransferase [Ureibacillus sp. GCM10028918]|uniref:NeuD/PglB/VioB family sugar acetyltransferase n=1 Tax=Ureibacillus sp. GCM10028918 TaxID=3273429 RepID=UPI00360C0884